MRKTILSLLFIFAGLLMMSGCKVDSKNKRRLGELSEQLDQEKSTSDQLRTELEAVKNTVPPATTPATKAAMEELIAEKERIEAEKEQLLKTASAKEAELAQQISNLQKAQTAAQAMITELEEKLANTADSGSLKKKNKELEQKVKSKVDEINKLKSLMENQSTSIDKLNATIDNHQQTITSYEKKIAALNAATSTNDTEIAAAKKTIADLESKLIKEQTMLKSTQVKLQTVQSKLETNSDKLQSATKEINNYKQLLKRGLEKIEELTAELEQFRMINIALEREIEKLKNDPNSCADDDEVNCNDFNGSRADVGSPGFAEASRSNTLRERVMIGNIPRLEMASPQVTADEVHGIKSILNNRVAEFNAFNAEKNFEGNNIANLVKMVKIKQRFKQLQSSKDAAMKELATANRELADDIHLIHNLDIKIARIDKITTFLEHYLAEEGLIKDATLDDIAKANALRNEKIDAATERLKNLQATSDSEHSINAARMDLEDLANDPLSNFVEEARMVYE